MQFRSCRHALLVYQLLQPQLRTGLCIQASDGVHKASGGSRIRSRDATSCKPLSLCPVCLRTSIVLAITAWTLPTARAAARPKLSEYAVVCASSNPASRSPVPPKCCLCLGTLMQNPGPLSAAPPERPTSAMVRGSSMDVMMTSRAPAACKALQAAAPSSSVVQGRPVRSSASNEFGVTMVANGKSCSR